MAEKNLNFDDSDEEESEEEQEQEIRDQSAQEKKDQSPVIDETTAETTGPSSPNKIAKKKAVIQKEPLTLANFEE